MPVTDRVRDLLAAALRTARFKGRWRVGRLLNRAFALTNPEAVKVRLPEVGWLRLDLRDREMLAQTYWVGLSNTDRDSIRLLTRLLDPDAVFVDVGANVGVYTLALARHLGRGAGRVIAFEPHPTNFRRLQEHIALNALTNVTAENLGVSDRPGTLEVAGTEHPGDWSLISEGPLRFTVALTT
ncbi:MAG: FkbM family methyltransferase, partial [Singulisphaera sp.]